jgi:glycerophosphoryl diester phosphodiesterase
MLFYLFTGWLLFAHTILQRFFTCCRKKKLLNCERVAKDGKPWPILSAHRGGSLERTENTLSAFKNAMSQGINMLECDVHMTRDEVVIVAHDSDLLRICGVSKSITDFTYEKLPPIAKEFQLHFSQQSYKQRPDEDGKFTTLRQLFETAPDRIISIDVKGQSVGLPEKVDALVREFNREEITIWGSMIHKTHMTLARLNPQVPRFFSGLECLIVYFLHYLGLLWLYPLPSDAFMVPLATYRRL